MTAPLVLVGFVLATAWLAPRAITGARWADRSPTAAIVAWQAAVGAVTLGVLLVGVSLALPVLPVGEQVRWLVRATQLELANHYLTPAGTSLAVAALVATAALALRASSLLAAGLLRARHARRRQRDALALVGVRHPEGFVLVEHATPVVYCLPGRGGSVVVTTAALAALTPDELASVLAHERRHLRARHDVALAITAALSRSFVGLRFFRVAHEQVAALAELHADDAARTDGSRRAMATALVRLAGGAPHAGLPARGADHASHAVARVRRLLAGSSRPRPTERLAVGAATLSLVALPVLLALAPAIGAAARDCCPTAIVTPVGQGGSGAR